MRQLVFLIPALVFVACATHPPPADKPLFDDVPVAEGLSYDRWTGNRTSSGHIRVGTQELSGRRGIKDVAQFYRTALPAHGWTLQRDEPGPPAKLSFVKKEEQCDIEVASAQDGVAVVVRLGYKK